MQKLQNMKIRIKDPEHSKQVQECLFALGYMWNHQTVAAVNSYASDDNIFVYDKGSILCASNKGIDYFNKHTNKEVTLEDLQAMLTPTAEQEPTEFASPPTEHFNSDNTISMYIQQLQKRLAETNMTINIYANEIRIANMENDDEAVVNSWDNVLEVIKVKQAYLDVF